jgi:MFS family permease
VGSAGRAPLTMAAPFAWRPIAVPAFGPSLLFGTGEGAILPVLPLTARELGASVPEAALLVALIGLGSMLGNIPASMITMRHGERWTIVGAAIACAAAMVLCAFTSSLAVFAFGAFVVGIAQAVFGLARQSWMAEAVPIEYRARAMSMLGGMMRVGMFIGPFMAAAAIHRWGVTAAYLVGAAALLVAAVVSWRLPDLPSRGGTASTTTTANIGASWRGVVRDHRHVFLTLGIGVMLVSAVRAARQAVIPLWADQLGLDASVTSLIYGIAGGVEMLVFYPAGSVMDRKGRLAVALPSLAIMGVALLLTPLAQSATTLLIAASAIGFGNGIGSGLIMTLGADHAPREGRAQFLGIWRLMSDIGAACGPGLLSLLTAVSTLGIGVAAIGLLAFAAAAQLRRWIPRRR